MADFIEPKGKFNFTPEETTDFIFCEAGPDLYLYLSFFFFTIFLVSWLRMQTKSYAGKR
jgi:cell division protein FtsW (lipid II flippase)